MRISILMLTLSALTRMCMFGQSSDAPTFEVASIKPASPSATGMSCSGGPGTSSPGSWRCSNVPLSFLISQYYELQPYEFPRNATCCQGRFDLSAKAPEGTTDRDFPRMIQNLLEERLKLKLHHEKKEMAIFELTAGERTVKLKESRPGASSEPKDPWVAPVYSIGKDGYPVFPVGHSGLVTVNGHVRWVEFNVSMDQIVRTLSFHLGRPVLDITELKGMYDIDMKWFVDVGLLLEMAGRRDELAELPDDTGSAGPTLIRAVQDQLGLRLISKKGLGDIVVIDHVEKLPSGN
jgi:uncharacterized protein (TIGR03435 family)